MNKRGQVWIETVIYTLIAFVMIGLVLSFAQPKIQQLQDQAVVQQSINLLTQIDSTINTLGGEGNLRIVELGIKQGELNIDGVNDLISFDMNTQSAYSEPGKNISNGDILIDTEKYNSEYKVTLTINYQQDYDIEFNGANALQTLTAASTPYELTIANAGEDAENRTILNMSLS